jgi:hypothetical protein
MFIHSQVLSRSKSENRIDLQKYNGGVFCSIPELLLDSVDLSHVLYYVPTVRIVSSFGHQEGEERAKLTEA